VEKLASSGSPFIRSIDGPSEALAFKAPSPSAAHTEGKSTPIERSVVETEHEFAAWQLSIVGIVVGTDLDAEHERIRAPDHNELRR
jgi:hypothetical protein